MNLFIIITSILYLTVFLLGLAKGFGLKTVSDNLRQKLIEITVLWHLLIILLPAWQYQNYFFVVEPYERVVAALAIVLVHLLWTKRYNILLLENFIFITAFACLFPLAFVGKLSPEIISSLWLEKGGLVKHIFLLSAIGMGINLVILDLTAFGLKELKTTLNYAYKITLGTWLLGVGSYYFWATNMQVLVAENLIKSKGIWFLIVTLFLVANLYYRQIQEQKPIIGFEKVIRVMLVIMLVCIFAVIFGM